MIGSPHGTCLGLPPGNGFEHGLPLEPSGATFDTPARLGAGLARPMVPGTLLILPFDEETHTWGERAFIAMVTNEDTRARFELSGSSSCDAWRPPLPTGTALNCQGGIIFGRASGGL